jgi:hypothetical protein
MGRLFAVGREVKCSQIRTENPRKTAENASIGELFAGIVLL